MFEFVVKVVSEMIFGRSDSSDDIGTTSYHRNKTSEIRKKDGSIDHRGHEGNDRTPAQKAGDKARRK